MPDRIGTMCGVDVITYDESTPYERGMLLTEHDWSDVYQMVIDSTVRMSHEEFIGIPTKLEPPEKAYETLKKINQELRDKITELRQLNEELKQIVLKQITE